MIGKAQITVASVVALLCGVSIYAHFHKPPRDGTGIVTVAVTFPNPFPPTYEYATGKIVVSSRERRHRRKWVMPCWQALNGMPKYGRDTVCGYDIMWI